MRNTRFFISNAVNTVNTESLEKYTVLIFFAPNDGKPFKYLFIRGAKQLEVKLENGVAYKKRVFNA